MLSAGGKLGDMIRRYELTDRQFAEIEDLLPPGANAADTGTTTALWLNGIFWWLRTGSQWREVPKCYGKWQNIDDRYNFWRTDGTFDRLAVPVDRRGQQCVKSVTAIL